MAYAVRQDMFREQVCSWLETCGDFDELSMKAWTKDHSQFEECDMSNELWYYDPMADDDKHAREWAIGDMFGNVDMWADIVKVVVHSVEGKKYQERFAVPKDIPVFVKNEAEYKEWRQKVL